MSYLVSPLTKAIAQQHAEIFVELLNLIPIIPYDKEKLLREEKPGRIFYNKWEHSFYVHTKDNSTPIGLLLSYERDRDTDEVYTEPCIYLSELAVHSDHQQKGVGQLLVTHFLNETRAGGFYAFPKITEIRVQTNAAPWNLPVQNFYTKLGFTPIAKKSYETYEDNVYMCLLTEPPVLDTLHK